MLSYFSLRKTVWCLEVGPSWLDHFRQWIQVGPISGYYAVFESSVKRIQPLFFLLCASYQISVCTAWRYGTSKGLCWYQDFFLTLQSLLIPFPSGIWLSTSFYTFSFQWNAFQSWVELGSIWLGWTEPFSRQSSSVQIFRPWSNLRPESESIKPGWIRPMGDNLSPKKCLDQLWAGNWMHHFRSVW